MELFSCISQQPIVLLYFTAYKSVVALKDNTKDIDMR